MVTELEIMTKILNLLNEEMLKNMTYDDILEIILDLKKHEEVAHKYLVSLKKQKCQSLKFEKPKTNRRKKKVLVCKLMNIKNGYTIQQRVSIAVADFVSGSLDSFKLLQTDCERVLFFQALLSIV